ncbi:MAG: glutathione S-transferase family protein [Alphaproteobacteria bacterium]|nr:glutathione S-transferase family protein [Alphaproteobacteria bacterium]
MALPRLYGDHNSRANRCLWTLYELGQPFEHVPMASGVGTKDAAFLAINPWGKIPTWVEDDWVLSESLAINLHLARRTALWPKPPQDRARAMQWTMWAATEAEPNFFAVARHRVLRPPERREERVAIEGEQALRPRLMYLDLHLRGRDFLLGDRFTVADINVAGVFSLLRASRIDLAPFPSFDGWLARLEARPTYAKAHGR